MPLKLKEDGTDVKEWYKTANGGESLRINGVPVNVQQIRNDTCGCERYEVRDASLQGDAYNEQQPIAYHEHPKHGTPYNKCDVHEGVANHHELQAVVAEENLRKNAAYADLLKVVPDSDKVVAKDGSVTFVEEPKWSFDADRKVILDHPALADAKVSADLLAALAENPRVDESKVAIA